MRLNRSLITAVTNISELTKMVTSYSEETEQLETHASHYYARKRYLRNLDFLIRLGVGADTEFVERIQAYYICVRFPPCSCYNIVVL